MGRRLMWNRACNVDQIYSATEEEGLEIGIPEDTSVSGLMQAFAGGNPTTAKTYLVDVITGGNLGGAEFGFGLSDEAWFNGVTEPWIIDRCAEVQNAAVINIPPRLVSDRVNDQAQSIWVEDTVLKYSMRSSSKAWQVEKTVATVTTGATADGWIFQDTGEAIIFCDGDLYSTDDVTDADSWFIKGTLPVGATFAGGASSTHISLVYSRGVLILLFIQTNKIYAALSYDRGDTWTLTTAVSDDFEDSINEADSIHCCVSPLDDNLYMVIEDDTNGGGSDDYLKIYRSHDGLEWEMVNADVNSRGVSSYEMKNASIFAMDDGTFGVTSMIVDLVAIYFDWLDVDGTFYYRKKARDVTDPIIGSSSLLCMEAIDMGDEVLATPMIKDVGGSNHEVINAVGLRWWSNLSEVNGYGLSWLHNTEDGPDSEWGWTANGNAAAEDVTNSYMQLTTDSTNILRTYEYTSGTGSAFEKIKFGARCTSDGDRLNRKVGLRVRTENSGGKGYDFGIYFDETGIQLYDHQTTATVSSVDRDLSRYNDVLVDIEFDEVSGGAEVEVWCRFEANEYPLDEWAIVLVDCDVAQSTPFSAEDSDLEWGNFDHVFAGSTVSDWWYLLTSGVYEGFVSTYKNGVNDHSDLTGKICSSLTQGFTDDMDLLWRGAGAYKDDRWTAATRYRYQKENVHRTDPKVTWRTATDGGEEILVLFEDADRPFRPDWVALFNKNFDRFYIEASQDGTFTDWQPGVLDGLSFQHDNPVDPTTSCYLNIGNAGGFDGNTSMSWCFWVKSDGKQAVTLCDRIYTRYWDFDSCEIIGIGGPAGSESIYVRIGTDAVNAWTGTLTFADAGVSNDEWFFVAITYDGGPNDTDIWINGVEKAWSTDVGTLPNALDTSPLYHYIGGSDVDIAGLCSFKGDVSQFRVFNTEINSTVIAALYNGGRGYATAYSDANLEMEYLFDEQAGTDVADTSSDGLDYSCERTTDDPHWVTADVHEEPEKGFSLFVGDGVRTSPEALVDQNALGHIAPDLEIAAVHEDWIEVLSADAEEAALWKGRFDKDAISGRRWWIRVVDGSGPDTVEMIESVERVPDPNTADTWRWAIRLAPKADGSYPAIVTDHGVDAGDHFGIFGDAIAVELPEKYEAEGYKYIRIRIVSQSTWDDYYQLGFLMVGMSLPLPNIIELKDTEWNSNQSISPNVQGRMSRDGTVTKNRPGRAARNIALSWSGQETRDSFQSAIRSALDAASSDTPVVWMENDEFEHTLGSPTLACRVCYDPVLCYLDGSIQVSQEAYDHFDPKDGQVDQRGMRTNVTGISLKEIV